MRIATRCMLAAAVLAAGAGMARGAVGVDPCQWDLACGPLPVCDHTAGEIVRYIIAGDPNGTPPDEPSFHVDPNILVSPHAGVASVLNDLDGMPGGSAILGSGALLSRRHVLTAAHLFDDNGDAVNDFPLDRTTVVFNADGDVSHTFGALAVDIHPDYYGTGGALLNDDLAIITLDAPVPSFVPSYGLLPLPVGSGQGTRMIGYGETGDGVDGAVSGTASLDVKRFGHNQIDAGQLDDEGGGEFEVWIADFDDPDASGDNFTGDESLGNDVESSIAGGDAGGPDFVLYNDALTIVGISTFGDRFVRPDTTLGPEPPLFDSAFGGVLVYPYLGWIDGIVPEPTTLALGVLGAAGLVLRRRR